NMPAEVGTHGMTYSLYSDILQLAKHVGWQYKSEITWYQPVYRNSTLGKDSAGTPHLVNPVERVMILYKYHWERKAHGGSPLGAESLQLTHGFWTITPDDTQDTSLHLARFPCKCPGMRYTCSVPRMMWCSIPSEVRAVSPWLRNT